MELFFIRHGETEGNLHKRYIGRTDEPLCEDGISRFVSLPATEKWLFMEPLTVVVSPMLRCLQSAALILGADAEAARQAHTGEGVRRLLLSTAHARGIDEIHIEEDLRECDFGTFENKNWQEMENQKDYQRWIDSGGEAPFPGGESAEGFKERSCSCFARLMEKLPDQRTLFVVHGGTIMSILECFGEDESGQKKRFYEWYAGNGQGFSASLRRPDPPENLMDLRLLCCRPYVIGKGKDGR